MNIKTYLYALLIFFLSQNLFSQNSFSSGLTSYQQEEYDKAIIFFTKAIAEEENIVRSYVLRASSEIFNNDFFHASSDLRMALKLDSNNFEAHYYYGRFYLFQGFYQSAIKQYSKAIEINPTDNIDLYNELAIAKIKVEDYTGAILAETIAIKMDSSVQEYYINRAFAQLRLNNYKETISDINSSLYLGQDPKAYSIRASAYAGLGQYKLAVDDYTIAIDKMKDAIDLYYYRGLSYKALGNDDKACIDFNKGSDLNFIPAKEEAQKLCQRKN